MDGCAVRPPTNCVRTYKTTNHLHGGEYTYQYAFRLFKYMRTLRIQVNVFVSTVNIKSKLHKYMLYKIYRM